MKTLHAQQANILKNKDKPKCPTCGTLVADMGACYDGTEHGNAYTCNQCGVDVLTNPEGEVVK